MSAGLKVQSPLQPGGIGDEQQMLPGAVLELPRQARALAAGIGGVGALRGDLEQEDRELGSEGHGEEGGAEGVALAARRRSRRWPSTAGTRSAASAGAE